MRIVYVTSRLPYPADNGGTIKTLATLSALSKEAHSVHLFCFGSKDSTRSIQKLTELGIRSVSRVSQELVYEKALFAHGTFFLRSLVRGTPYTLEKFFSKSLKRAVDAFCARTKPDVVWIDHFNLIPYVPASFSGKTVLEEHNIQSLLFLRIADNERNTLWRSVYLWESTKWKRFERHYLKPFSVIATISEYDKQYLEKQYSLSSVRYLGTATSPSRKRLHRKKQLLFIGRLTWQPNKHGLSWFIKQVWPMVYRLFPDYRLVVVGDYAKKPSSSPGVLFEGRVADIEKYFLESSLLVCPIFSGSGIRIKIIQAMSYGLPVVSTTLGAEGIPVERGYSILLADTVEEFSRTIERLLTEQNLRVTVAKHGKAVIKNHFSPSGFQKRIHEILA